MLDMELLTMVTLSASSFNSNPDPTTACAAACMKLHHSLSGLYFDCRPATKFTEVSIPGSLRVPLIIKSQQERVDNDPCRALRRSLNGIPNRGLDPFQESPKGPDTF